MSTAAIELRGVCKRYRYFQLDNVSFRLDQGQIMGFVGPNGAGKTTTIKILMGWIQQDAGEVRVHGYSIPQQQVQAKWDMGFVSDDVRLFGNATLGWHMHFIQSIYPDWNESYAKRLLKRFYLRAEQKVSSLSHGERVKAQLLLVLARRPRLLVLDEPTTGLDPVARQEVIAELMEVLKEDDRSILYSSHHTSDVEQISDQITFIDRGRIVDCRDKEVFIDCWRRLMLDIPDGFEFPVVGGITDISKSGHAAVVTVRAYSPALHSIYEQAGATVREVQRMTLEEIFVANVMHNRRERGE